MDDDDHADGPPDPGLLVRAEEPARLGRSPAAMSSRTSRPDGRAPAGGAAPDDDVMRVRAGY